MRLAANLSFLFADLPLPDRIDAAAGAGFEGVEIIAPYGVPARTLRARLDATGLTQVLINSYAGDWDKGERGLACLPGRERDFRDAVRRTLDYAGELGCGLVHLMAGIPPAETELDRAMALFTINLDWAATQAQAAGIRLAIEAINQRDIPGYLLRTQEQAAALAATVGTDRVGLQFDIYHCQTAQGDVTRRLEALYPLIAHIQVADVPGRNEPGTGEIGWDFLFGRLRSLGYDGWIGCEYRPAGDTLAGLAWRGRYRF